MNKPKKHEKTDPCDRAVFKLNAEQWTVLQTALDAPAIELPRLKFLVTKPRYFDSTNEDGEHERE